MGKLKRKGAYEYNTLWHQDPSALVIPKAAEKALVHGKSIREFITEHHDPFDFMLRAKVPRGSKLMLRWPGWDVETELQHITRYFVARNGGSLVEVSPPTGEPGTWKRRAKITDEFYNAVMREIAGSRASVTPPEHHGTLASTRVTAPSTTHGSCLSVRVGASWSVLTRATLNGVNWITSGISPKRRSWYIP